PALLKDFKKCIKQSQGIVLVTGPTGSGKTTTLYSALTEIHTPETNIMTIEDPVEYKLEGMAQIGVHSKIGLTFAKGLRHILRQDPDIVMIGEIRDRETAEIAIQASLTGHLVLSTLHTNDAPSAITRLVDMGIEPFLLSSSVIGALAQRLVRRICSQCKESYEPSGEELSELGLKKCQLYKGAGCEACFGSGYRGRAGLYELMHITPRIKKQLLESADASALQRIAVEDGLQTLRDHGAQLAKEGVTTSAEVLRVTRQIEL
ncbi:MAG: type II/IV secretion system protein, partial [Chlamydiia bacterium]|nr:type II/IV secretion system protein [Chlamydiia bacterium]